LKNAVVDTKVGVLSKDNYSYLKQNTKKVLNMMIFKKNKAGVSHSCPKFAVFVLFYLFWSGAGRRRPPLS